MVILMLIQVENITNAHYDTRSNSASTTKRDFWQGRPQWEHTLHGTEPLIEVISKSTMYVFVVPSHDYSVL